MHICSSSLILQHGNSLLLPTHKQWICSLSKNKSRNVTLFDKGYLVWKCPVGVRHQNNMRNRPWLSKYIKILSLVPLLSLGCFYGSLVKQMRESGCGFGRASDEEAAAHGW